VIERSFHDGLCTVDTTVDTDFSGTTFVAACVRHNRITVANVGDSRCTLGYRDEHGNIVAEAISIDHKPDHPEERVRVVCIRNVAPAWYFARG
jgi:serine/threonine protein phosphatase PrpC